MKNWSTVLYAALVLLGLLGPNVSVSADENIELFVRVTTPAYRLDSRGLSVAGYAQNSTPGAPALPVYGTVVELPPQGNWHLSVVDTGARTLPGRAAIPPALSFVSSPPEVHGLPGDRAVDASMSAHNVPDPAIYERNAFYPGSIVSAGQEQWQRGKRLLPVRVFPFQYNPVTGELLYHPDVRVTIRILEPSGRSNSAGPAPAAVDTRQSSASGELGALRLRTSQRGMHRLTYSDLTGAGIDVAQLDPASFVMTYLGQPVCIQVTGAGDGSFDPGDLVIFYAEPYVGRWMTSNVYRLSWGTAPAPPETRMTARELAPSGLEPVVTTISQTLHIEQDTAYFSDFWISTEADHFFDTSIPDQNTGSPVRSYSLPLDDPAPAGNMSISGLLYGGQDQGMNPDEWAKLQVNNHDVAAYTWDGRKPYTITAATAPMTWLDQPTNQLKLIADSAQLPGIGSYWYYPDWLSVTYPALADAEGDRIEIEGIDTASTSAEVQVTGFTTNAVSVFDVSDPRNPVQILATTAEPAGSGTQINFWDAWNESDPPRAYSLSTMAALLPAAATEVDAPSDWKSPNHEADYIAIVHRSLWGAIDPLLQQRSAQGLRVAKVDVQDIYDEFNDGRLHQKAIRDFLAYAYANWNPGGPRPQYVLLVGDATFDFKGIFAGTTMKVLVPAFLGNFDPWLVETASDTRFATLDGPGDRLPEMLVGRIPAQTPQQVTDYVNKVLAYEDKSQTADGAWQNQVAYIADDDENAAGNFHSMSDDIRLNWLPSYYTSSTVYFNPNGVPAGGYTSTGAMKSGIKQSFDNGQVYLQWFGHASKYRWGTVSGIWNTFDPVSLTPNSRLPFVAAFSCLEGYFLNIDTNLPWSMVLGEQHLLEAGRGGIAGLSPSGKHIGSALTVLDQGLTKSIFQDRLAGSGAAVDAARRYYFANSTSWMDVLDTSIFFGDPALQLRLPLPPPVAPEAGVAVAGPSSVNLSWLHIEADTSYKLWRGASPYFDADVEGAVVGTVDAALGKYTVGAQLSYSDDGATPPPPVTVIGDPATNYYWLIRGANWRGVSSDSNRVGEFDFALIPGDSTP